MHDWHIAEREYSRQEQHRGRRHAFEQIDPVRTALVVIDTVSFVVEEMDDCRGIVPDISRASWATASSG